MQSNTFQANPANPQTGIDTIQVKMRVPAGTYNVHLLLRPAIRRLLAFFIIFVTVPLSGSAAHAPELTPRSNGWLDHASQAQIQRGELLDQYLYLPLITRNFPIVPLAPVLDPVSNADGDGNYTLTWTAVEGGDNYLLQEDDNDAFASPTTAYAGPGIAKAISGKNVGVYFYRVMAYNSYASGGWSNTQPVTVSVSPPACPQTGSWRGITSQRESFEFVVETSPKCQIAAGSLKISWRTALCGSATITFLSAISITDNKFSVINSSPSVKASGEFTAPGLATGTLLVDYMSGYNRCYYSGSWEAYPVVGANGPVMDLLVQPDGKILAGGKFSEIGGQTHHNLARLNPDGSPDSAFTPVFNSSVQALAIQADNKILAVGLFNLVGGEVHDGVARLNPDGSLDTSFNAQIVGDVYELALQSDGKILVGGWINTVNGQPRAGLARLNSDGTLDEAFNVVASYIDVYALMVQPDDKILLGGFIEDVAGVAWADYFVRLNPDGTLDTTFQPGIGDWADGFAIQADGKILVTIYSDLARFNSDGTRDTSFISPDLLSGSIRHVVIQTDGALVVGGDFINLGADPYDYLAQLDTNGTLKPAFNPTPNNKVYALALQPDNKILVGGAFTKFDGQVRHSIVRLNPDGSLDQSFATGP